MKALIFNSGLGSRLGELTRDKPKSMIRLGNGETIFERQLRILHSCGVNDFIVTSGPFPEQLRGATARFEEIGCSFVFVENSVYAETNYIYSMYLARDYLYDDDILLLHGDLVFDAHFAQMVIDAEYPSLCSVNASIPLPAKDFKGRIVDGRLREVSVDIFDDDCVALQPLYKMSPDGIKIWLDAVERFVDDGEVGVYAENAANTVFSEMDVVPFSYEGHLVEEIDTPEDLERVSSSIRLFDFEQQPVFKAELDAGLTLLSSCTVKSMKDVNAFADLLIVLDINKPLVVTGSHFEKFRTRGWLNESGLAYEVFRGFSPNPTYEEVLSGVGSFTDAGCDSLISIGGGSAIDVAKSIKLLVMKPDDESDVRLEDEVGQHFDGASDLHYLPHLAIPTTAGTGSESTHFSVCYVDGDKTSLADDSIMPDAVVLDAALLKGLSEYQKKCTLLDALCQVIESYWSVKSSEQSRWYSAKAIPILMDNAESYLVGDQTAAEQVLEAANLAGKAINLTTTTAAHAMSYKLTSLYGLPHGHAVAVCMPHVWKLLVERGSEDTHKRLEEISMLMTGSQVAEDGLGEFERLVNRMGIATTVNGSPVDIHDLVASVNTERLGNFPIKLDSADLEKVYSEIVLTE